MSPRPWQTLSSRTLLSRWWLTLREDRVRLPSGQTLDEFHVAECPDWSCVLALTSQGEAVLVEQYRHGIGRLSLELPAGVIDQGETPEAAARRELLEETGYEAGTLTAFGRLAVEPGRNTNYGHVFVARECRKVADPRPDPGEDLAVSLHPLASLPALVRAGRMVHAVHVAALFWAFAEGVEASGEG